MDREDHATPGELFATLEEMTMIDTVVRATTGALVYDDIVAAHDAGEHEGQLWYFHSPLG